MAFLLKEIRRSYMPGNGNMDFMEGNPHCWWLSNHNYEGSQEPLELPHEQGQQDQETTRRDQCKQDRQFSSAESSLESDCNFLLRPDPCFDNLLMEYNEEGSQEFPERPQEQMHQNKETTRRNQCEQDGQFSSDKSFLESDCNFLMEPDPWFDDLMRELGMGCDGERMDNKEMDKTDNLPTAWDSAKPAPDGCQFEDENDGYIHPQRIVFNHIPGTIPQDCHEERPFWNSHPWSQCPAVAAFPHLLDGEADTTGSAHQKLAVVEPEVQLSVLSQCILQTVDVVSRGSLDELAGGSGGHWATGEEPGPTRSLVSPVRHSSAWQELGQRSEVDASTTEDMETEISLLSVSFASVSLTSLEELCADFFRDEDFAESLENSLSSLSLSNRYPRDSVTHIGSAALTGAVFLEETGVEAGQLMTAEWGGRSEISHADHAYQGQFARQMPGRFRGMEDPTGTSHVIQITSSRSSPKEDDGVSGNKQRDKDANILPSSEELVPNLNNDAQKSYFCSACGNSYIFQRCN